MTSLVKTFTSVLCLAGLAVLSLYARVLGQGSSTAPYRVPHGALQRGPLAHSITMKGMSGRQDIGTKQEWHGFDYPGGRSFRAYSGGLARTAWGHNAHTAGEGIWLMSRSSGAPRITYVGNQRVTNDVEPVLVDAGRLPEAYASVSQHPRHALASPNNLEAYDAAGGALTYWPARGSAAGKTPKLNTPFVLGNYSYSAYPSAVPFATRVDNLEFARLAAPPWAMALSEDDFPEKIGLTRGRSLSHGLEWTRRWFLWSHADYDDFVINETTVVNTSASGQDGVYLVIQNRLYGGTESAWYTGGAGVEHNLEGPRLHADDWTRSTLADNYLEGSGPLVTTKPAGNVRGADLAKRGHPMLYAHDGDQTDPAWPQNDWGGPYVERLAAAKIRDNQMWIEEGFLQDAAYFGVGVVDALPPFNTYGGVDPDIFVAPHDSPDTKRIDESTQQPASVTMWHMLNHQFFDQPDPSNHSDIEIYELLTREWPTPSGYMLEPTQNEAYTQFLTFGPYNLAPGEKFRVVVAYVGGMASQNVRYSDYRRHAKPFEFGWMNLYDGPTSTADASARQNEIPLGEDEMFSNFERALDAYNWGYDIPNQPPHVRLNYRFSDDAKNVINWTAFGEDSADPDYEGEEARDIRGYRIYRSDTEPQGPWEFMAEFSIEDVGRGTLPVGVTFEPDRVWVSPNGYPLREDPTRAGDDPVAGALIPGTYSWKDMKSIAGFPYNYMVRYYDSGHDDWHGRGPVRVLESGPGPGKVGGIMNRFYLYPQMSTTDTYDRMETPVAVVPNPYRIGDFTHSYLGSKRVRFIHLPQRAQIDLYDVTGQKVWTQFNAEDTEAAEITWPFVTVGGRDPSPGIYYWKVTSLMPESMNEVHTGTLLIIK